MTVPFLNLLPAYSEMQCELEKAVARVLSSGVFIGGPEVTAFEQRFADYCQAAHCVGAGNGLEALHLALRALGVRQGDEVIVASNGFIATWLAVTMAGATPVAVEPDSNTYNLNPALIESAITCRTRVILPTHLYGQPADLSPISDVAQRHGLKLLEDGAQAHGARYKGKRVGTHGDAVTWSFYPSKNLGALGDAGAVTTSNLETARRIRQLGNYGSTQRYVHEVKGFNSRLDPIQAAVLSTKLALLDQWNDRRRAVAARYLTDLEGCGLVLPRVLDGAEPVWHLFVVRHEERDELANYLSERGIDTLIHYPVPPHLQAAYADLGFGRGAFPIAERLADEVISLPIGPHLNERQVDAVVQAVRAFCRAGA